MQFEVIKNSWSTMTVAFENGISFVSNISDDCNEDTQSEWEDKQSDTTDLIIEALYCLDASKEFGGEK